jgi:hypothetical protein
MNIIKETPYSYHNSPYPHLVLCLNSCHTTPQGGEKPPAPVNGRSTPSTHDTTFSKTALCGIDIPKHHTGGCEAHPICADIPGAPIAPLQGVMAKTEARILSQMIPVCSGEYRMSDPTDTIHAGGDTGRYSVSMGNCRQSVG